MGKQRGTNHSEEQIGHDLLGFNLGLSMEMWGGAGGASLFNKAVNKGCEPSSLLSADETELWGCMQCWAPCGHPRGKGHRSDLGLKALCMEERLSELGLSLEKALWDLLSVHQCLKGAQW